MDIAGLRVLPLFLIWDIVVWFYELPYNLIYIYMGQVAQGVHCDIFSYVQEVQFEG